MDVHHHFTAPGWIDWAEAHGITDRSRLPWWTRWDRDTAIEMMDKAGISTSVMTLAMPAKVTDQRQRKDSVSVALEAAAALAEEHPRRFAYFVPVFLEDVELSLWAVRRGLELPGAVGVSSRTSFQGQYLGAPEQEPLLSELNDRSTVISTHPMEVPASGRDGHPAVPGLPPFMCDFLVDTTRAALNLIFGGTMDKCPNLSFILPHGGGFLPYLTGRLEVYGGSLNPKMNPVRLRGYLDRLYVDTAAPMSPYTTSTLLATVDQTNLLYGSDWPPTPASVVADTTSQALDSDPALTVGQRRAINRENALRLFPALARLTSVP